MQQGGESGGWTEFDAPVDGSADWSADLTKLQGDNAQEFLRVQLADGEYTKVFVHVGEVTGELTSGNSVTLKLPAPSSRSSSPL